MSESALVLLLTNNYLRWQGKNVKSADNQSSILYQKPNIRTDVQRCSVSPKQKPKERTKVEFIPSPLLLLNTPVSGSFGKPLPQTLVT